jgi:hypothetical protein
MRLKPGSETAPPAVVTEMSPLTALLGTLVVIEVEVSPESVALAPPTVTAADLRPVPVMVIGKPVPCVMGVKLVNVGTGANAKPLAVAVPCNVATKMFPSAEPAGTSAVIDVSVFAVIFA